MKRLIANIFILLGFLLLVFGAYLLYLRQSPNLLTFKGDLGYKETKSQGTNPSRIKISSIELDLPIVPAITDGKNWETTNFGVSYLKSTPLPGDTGNSIIYGHNWESLLRKLPSVKPGQKIEITFENGSKKTFKIEYTAVVNPDQTYIVKNTNDTRLTIYTCTGFLDSKRFVAVAKPV